MSPTMEAALEQIPEVLPRTAGVGKGGLLPAEPRDVAAETGLAESIDWPSQEMDIACRRSPAELDPHKHGGAPVMPRHAKPYSLQRRGDSPYWWVRFPDGHPLHRTADTRRHTCEGLLESADPYDKPSEEL